MIALSMPLWFLQFGVGIVIGVLFLGLWFCSAMIFRNISGQIRILTPEEAEAERLSDDETVDAHETCCHTH